MAVIGELRDIVDPHAHVRTLERARDVLPHSSWYCSHLLLMPNVPPLVDGKKTMEYTRGALDIIRAAGHTCGLIPCMMLDDTTTPEMIRAAAALGVRAAKLYPKGATTRDESIAHVFGVSNFEAMLPVFREMEAVGMVLNLHGEMPNSFVLDREADFLYKVEWLAETLAKLRIVLEHITTAKAVALISRLRAGVVATITAHHLFDTLDVVLGDKANVHAYCKPVHKRPEDRDALLWAVLSGNPKFFFGSDTAPHAKEDKECAFGCAGAFTAPHAVPLVLTALRRTGMTMAQIIGAAQVFLSRNAMLFYNLDPAGKCVTVTDEEFAIPAEYPYGDTSVVPYRAGDTLPFTIN